MKILAYGDSPAIETGFAQVNKPILKHFHDQGHEVVCVGVNQKTPYYDKSVAPYLIVGDPKQGGQFSVDILLHYLENWDFDVLWTHQDFGVLDNFVEVIASAKKKRSFKWIAYCPVDSAIFYPGHLKLIETADVVGSYTKWGIEVVREISPKHAEKMIYMPLPNTGDFKPFDRSIKHAREKLRQDLFGVTSNDTFVVMNLNRNHDRKDPFKTLQAFQGFSQGRDTILYMHMQHDIEGGMDIPKMAEIMNLADKVRFPDMKEGMGFPRKDIPKLYQAADLVVSSSRAEGWGYSCTEAMATRTPVVMPNHTSLTELIGAKEERGYLIDAGKDADHWALGYRKNTYPYPVVHLDSMIEKMDLVYNDWLKAKDYKGTNTGKKLDKAEKWIKTVTWNKVLKQWGEVLNA